jgi:transposase
MVLQVREMTSEEHARVEQWARSRTEPARVVERARIVTSSRAGMRVSAIARLLHVSEKVVRLWVKRFNANGLAGLADKPRAGRPTTYTPDEVGEVLAAALSKPLDLGLPFASWTLDRLEVYLNEEKSIPIKRSRIDELLIDEGLRWRTQEGWFGERAGREKPTDPDQAQRDQSVDPEFAQKRGRLRPSTRSRRRAA